MPIIVVDEGSEPALRAGAAAGPCAVKPIDSHRQRLKPLLDFVAVSILELTAEIAPREGGQVAKSVDKECCLGEIMLVFQLGEERRGGGLMSEKRFESQFAGKEITR